MLPNRGQEVHRVGSLANLRGSTSSLWNKEGRHSVLLDILVVCLGLQADASIASSAIPYMF